MAVTDYTLETMARWVHSREGLRRSLHPFRGGRFLGSGNWETVMREAGLDGPAQLAAIKKYAEFTALQK